MNALISFIEYDANASVVGTSLTLIPLSFVKSYIMAKLLLLVLVALCLQTNSSYAQVKENDSLKNEYLRKWRTQRTTGWVFLGTGLTVMVIGTVVTASEIFVENPSGPTVFLMGTFVGLASIPFFVSASTNRRKAVEVSVASQSIRLPVSNMSNRSLASLKLTINF